MRTRRCRAPIRAGASPSTRPRRRSTRTSNAAHATTAALIVEPLVQGASGMTMYDARYLRLAREITRAPRRAPHRRRDHDGLRTHRYDVRVGAGAHGRAGLPVPVEGHHRRLPAAVLRAGDRRGLRVVLCGRHGARLPALALLHGQSAGVPRGARGARHLPRRRRDRGQPGPRATVVGAPRAAGGAPQRARLPQLRHDLRFRGRRPNARTSPAGASRKRWVRNSCCVRSVAPSTSCRPTS